MPSADVLLAFDVEIHDLEQPVTFTLDGFGDASEGRFGEDCSVC